MFYRLSNILFFVQLKIAASSMLNFGYLCYVEPVTQGVCASSTEIYSEY